MPKVLRDSGIPPKDAHQLWLEQLFKQQNELASQQQHAAEDAHQLWLEQLFKQQNELASQQQHAAEESKRRAEAAQGPSEARPPPPGLPPELLPVWREVQLSRQ